MPVSRRSLFQAAAALTLLAVVPGLRAQDKDLPKAEEVLDKYIEVTGGKAAYEKLTNRVAKGTIEVVGQNLQGPLEIYQAAPNKQLVVIELENVGTISQGTDGELAWSIDPTTGDRIMEGDEKTNFLRDAVFNSELLWQSQYKTVETVGLEELDGKPCYKLTLTPAAGDPLTAYYEKESGLLAKISQVAKTPQGEIAVDSIPTDYREVDGIKMPFVNTQSLAGVQLRNTLTEVKHNVDLPADKFAIPDAIKKLQETK